LNPSPISINGPLYYRLVAKLFGRKGFDIASRIYGRIELYFSLQPFPFSLLASRIYGRIERSWFQIRIVAVKER
jgi:hypothetical protein